METAKQFAGKGVVVTGALGVFGLGIAKAFAEAGAKVCVTDRDQAALAALARELGTEGSFGCAAELTSKEELETLIAAVGEKWGHADVLINNAGVYPSGFLLDIDADEWDRIFDVNLRAPFILTRGFARQMIDKGAKGSIINISSGAARKMRRTVVPYCTSKTALDRMTKGFALELAEFGIRVNALEPGFAAGSTASPLTDAHVKNTVSNIPLGRASTIEDIAPGLFYLASDASSYVTGSTLTIDGGNSAGTMTVTQDKKSPL